MSTDAVEAAARELRRRGQRVTRPRLAVIRALSALDGHPGADEVAAAVAAGPDAVHRATVYRTLDTLAGLGVVTHVHSSHGTTAYHLADLGEPHLHARCRVCGTVVDLPGDLLDDVTDRVSRSAGFELEADHLALTGRCAACR
jgi:Fur family transcriptional regulator, ferric uptake regulator